MASPRLWGSPTWLTAAAFAAPFLAGCDGCGAGNEDSGGGTADGGAGQGASVSSFAQGGGGSTGTLPGGGNAPQGGGCAGDTKTAEKVPLDMYLMLDQSGSMEDPASGGGTRWEAVVSAIGTFVNQPEAAGIGVGIQYFPLQGTESCNSSSCTVDADCGGAACGPCIPFGPFGGICPGFGSSDSCEVSDYATPDVEIALLPGNAGAISSSMASHSPTGNTPTSAALEGAVTHAKDWALGNPGHVVIAVLATDGDPTTCNSDLAYINMIASTAANGTPPILTFVIGVGGSVAALNGIAAAGGTNTAFMIDQDPNVQQAFLDALNTIQGQALPCAYLIPQPEEGEDINFTQINVYYTPSGGSETVVPRVDSAAACPADGLAWYYDNNAAPTQILLCPATCTTISQDIGGSVRLLVGCDTVVE